MLVQEIPAEARISLQVDLTRNYWQKVPTECLSFVSLLSNVKATSHAACYALEL